MGNTRQLIPAARRDELVIQEVDGETLIYDLKSHKAHCLNHTAALVWKHCDGKRTAEQLARRLERELQTPVSSELVWLALEQLEKLGLLERAIERAPGMKLMSRREVVRRIGISAAIALPLATSIIAPPAAHAASCLPLNASCTGPGQCCPPFTCGFGNTCIDPR